MGCKIIESMSAIKSQVYKMDAAVNLAYICMIAKLPSLFVGNPGTGKSHTFKLIAKMFGERDQDWFYQSITAKTSPEKLFGGIIAEDMLNGVETYNLDAGAATKIGNIFDELFKSQHPAMMNTLLNYFDEDPTIFSGGKNITPSWQWAFTTTNFEDLAEDLRFDPLWDRMAAKYIVNNLNSSDSRIALKMVAGQKGSSGNLPSLTVDDLLLARKTALASNISDDIIDVFYDKVLPILEKYAYVSQRKITSIFVGKGSEPSIMQSIAYVTGDTSSESLGWLPYFCWQDTQTFSKMLAEVESVIVLPVVKTYRQIERDLTGFLEQAANGTFHNYDAANARLNMLLEATKASAGAYSASDKKKLPESLVSSVRSLSKHCKDAVDSMNNKLLADIEF